MNAQQNKKTALNKSLPVSELICEIDLFAHCAMRRMNEANQLKAEDNERWHDERREMHTFLFCAGSLAEKCGLASFVYSDHKIASQLQPAVEAL